MKKALTRAFCALVCFVMLFSFSAPALADELKIGTTVRIIVDSFAITSQTEDCTIQVGGDQTLMVGVSGTADTYKWELSRDDGISWTQIAATPTYDITNAQLNEPASVPYQYRVTVTSPSGTTDDAVISVLVSNDYAYRTIALRNGDTEVSSYMHDQTRLVVTPLPDNAPAALEMEGELLDSCVPLLICDISLVNQNDQVVPYFGQLQIDFDVGSDYDGETLRVFHYKNGTTKIYTGTVSSGILSIFVDELSPFMVEVPSANTHTVTVNVGTGGSVTPSGTVYVAEGSDKTLTVLPNAGYEVSSVTVDGAPVSITGNSYTLVNITANTTINVSFQPVTPSETLHTVTINAPAHGSVYPSGGIQVRHGSAQTIYFYPDAGYELSAVTVNGAPVNVIGSSYTLSAVTADTTVVVSFTVGTSQPPDVYRTIYTSAGANGSISPMGDVSVEYGGDMYFYFIPNDGYEVDKLTVDGTETAVSGNFYHFVNVVEAHTINVSFKPRVTPPPPTYYTITADSGANGSISPAGNVLVAESNSQTFYLNPDAGYEVDTVIVDNAEKGVSGTSYRFADVTSNHTIRVTFKKIATPPEPIEYHTITAGSGENGAISPDGDVRIAEGRNAYFYFMPDEGYEVDTVTVDGKKIAVEEYLYCFENVKADHSIYVTFKEVIPAPEPTVYHTISVSVEGNGNISPSGNVQVPEGGVQTFYLIADDGYEVEAIYVNGKKQDVVAGQFTVDGVSGDMELRVSFKPISDPASDGAPHCFLCNWVGRDIAPWCWLIPIILVAALGGALWLLLHKRRK